ncbi:MAG: DmsC/YnfH family molybdoenzyme membrane anchor subunit [Pseudomonadota bacterium]
MHPAPSIIFFTTLSGLGFGMLTFLGLDFPAPRGWAAFWLFLLAYALAVGGLLSSTFHLGHPERALKAFTQWRSSWLSREAWFAVAALGIMGIYAIGLVFFDTRLNALGILGGLLSLGTVFATSMIYTQMRTVPRWNHWGTPILFLAYAIVGGALLTGRVELARAILPLLLLLQIFAWVDQTRHEEADPTNVGTATGLDERGTVRAFEAPHTGENYLTKEMVFRIGRKHSRVLKGVTLLTGMGLPAVLLFLPTSFAIIAFAVLLHLFGVLVQRWLFFAEARHVVSFYYGH